MWYTRNIFLFFFINWTLRMSDNLPERVQILGHAHILCITVWDNRIICCQIFCDLLLKSAFERIFNVMQLILVKIRWHIKWKYLIQKFHDICLSYYFNNIPIKQITISNEVSTLDLFWISLSCYFMFDIRFWFSFFCLTVYRWHLINNMYASMQQTLNRRYLTSFWCT